MDSIRLEPNFKGMFRDFSREARLQAERHCREGRLEVVSALRSVIVPVTIAAQSATTVDDIEALRETLSELSLLLAGHCDAMEAQQEDFAVDEMEASQ